MKITNDNPHTFLANTTISGPGHLQIVPENSNFGSPLTVSGINLTNSPKIGRLYLGKSGISTKLVLDADITTNGRIYNYMPTEVNGGDRSISTTNDNINFYKILQLNIIVLT